MGISIVKMRWPWDSLIFITGIPILVRRHLYIEMAPACPIFEGDFEACLLNFIGYRCIGSLLQSLYSWHIMKNNILHSFRASIIFTPIFNQMCHLCTFITHASTFEELSKKSCHLLRTAFMKINFMVISRAPHDHIAANIVFANILRCVTVPEARDNQK